MMFSDAHPLAGASALPLRIKFYVDGWNSFKFAEEAASVSRTLLEEGLSIFPEYAKLFDFELPPEKMARFVAGCLYQVKCLIVSRHEDILRSSGIDVIDHTSAMLRLRGWKPPVLFREKSLQFNGRGKTYFDVTTHGIVFCPTFDRHDLTRQLERFLEETRSREPKEKYKYVVRNIESYLYSLNSGGAFDQSQKYYTCLGKEIGEASRRGYLKVSTNTGDRIVIEKAVDGDMQTRITADAYSDAADVLVLLTNDGDHYPAAKTAKELGKTVLVVRYSGEPAKALKAALGDENIIRLYDHERQNYSKYQFGFDPIWLRNQDKRSLQMIEDMQQQYAWWEMNGHVKRPAFPPR